MIYMCRGCSVYVQQCIIKCMHAHVYVRSYQYILHTILLLLMVLYMYICMPCIYRIKASRCIVCL